MLYLLFDFILGPRLYSGKCALNAKRKHVKLLKKLSGTDSNLILQNTPGSEDYFFTRDNLSRKCP